ncbi:hypothetical protein M501DRAFT_1006410 [Patellaria atrata CBS 101060]|uniref:DUF8004 domain-containing protein n=1 Tax=Patellaria atrata CBS 101060 TaxID=1346257 RepID=A0A9P4S8L1_9PEZI|nr:hypothetical protein M501DRAFT_1006410 [Patellaria atrata CBS 101060]
MRKSAGRANVKRWDGRTRTTSEWDGIRMDSELWFPDGNCLVNLYEMGQSRRGPSFCVNFDILQEARCVNLLNMYQVQKIYFPREPTDYGYDTSRSDFAFELYIPAPADMSKVEAFNWHLTTRNFFAFLFGRPLVGIQLGKTLVELQERLQLFRSEGVNSHAELMMYLDGMGYLNFAHCTDYALAALYYAEYYRIAECWTDAYAHCVGMNDRLYLSLEFSVSLIIESLLHFLIPPV